ncbi:putative ribosomally synthesized peptide with SipW-like signal peptide [Halarchaeum rubridurum]|uniref:Putative ribosomally synthesized peptide with SipW-like signal peptide n=1 Tax=Halarchaeum rubridurum TaxID=489911 RepID=A0A830FVS5_9EURY|nr:TasA family protein [Halarchaeum rubridurum]MBP1953190.1 putative ribosomally synthesized peptide with SipW-like signal peptide [Halarchaeum rubridurum]GGM67158.1 hypothetical protein GCM10009017_16650 [Halarchaeum rubridurum]
MSDEQSSRVRLTRRKLLAGLGTIGAAGAASGAGTFALFSDSEASTGNEIDMGTMDLVVRDGDSGDGFGDGVSGTFTVENAKPGDTMNGSVELKNAGSIAADHVELGFSVSPTEGSYGGTDGGDTQDGATGMAGQFGVGQFDYPKDGSGPYDTLDVDGLDAGADGPEMATLADLVDGTNADELDDLNPPPEPDGTRTLDIGLKWLDDAEHDLTHPNNDFQGDTLDVTIHFALAQEPDQDVL